MISTSTAYDLIYNALQVCGVVSYGESIDPSISKTALQMLNGIRAEWSGKYINNKRYDRVYTATSNQYSVSLGHSVSVSGDILVRPQSIEQVSIIMGNVNYEIPIKSMEEYRQLTITNIYALPAYAYLDNEYPIQNIYLYPGLAAGYGIRVIGRAYMEEYEHISDTYIDPPELFQCFIYALALKLGPMFGTDPISMQNVFQMLSSALKPMKSNNFINKMKRAKNDLGGPGSGVNIFSGV